MNWKLKRLHSGIWFARDMLNRYKPKSMACGIKRGFALGRKSEHGFTQRLAVIKAEEKHLEGLKVNREVGL